ncbi:S8 family serine peptidase [Streptomyces cavernae]|uniref:S8 family serine peptidase n=1 Tax=Streptomyces cavernae TaxID=2259034 RepID=UPI001390815C|nr:S8 family serine peptidase [Streptomyces cavernae]
MTAGNTGRRATGLVAAALLAAGAAVVPPAAADEPLAEKAVPERSARSRTVTLVTGDEVTLTSQGGKQGVTVRAGKGREGIGFVQSVVGDTFTVLPSDAVALVRQGKLDKRLFDIKKLVDEGYDDASRSVLPLIVSYAKGAAGDTASDRLAATRTGRNKAGTELPSIGAEAIRQPKAGGEDFWASATRKSAKSGSAASGRGGRALAAGISRIWLDGRVHANLDRSTAQIGAPEAWKSGVTGKGVKVAVLDTGIDTTHPDLSDAIAGSRDFTEGDTDGVVDGSGHGTHVASTITGSGAASDGKYKGVAPDAQLLVGKVLDDGGMGFDSEIIAGMEWAADQKADVINMSLGGEATDGTDPLSLAVNALTESSGALFVVAAGNEGMRKTVSAPAAADAALAVGAVDRDDRVAAFSSQGPRKRDHAVKPEITAPGVGIVAARAAGTSKGKPVGEQYTALSGTSMAGPHVAGAAAILAQQHPDWKPEQLKAALVSTSEPGADGNVFQQGTGRVDVAKAVRQSAHASPGTASMVLPWGSTKPVERTVTYHNDGDKPLELTLSLDLATEKGTPGAPASLRDTKLTVPAHGTAQTVLTGRPGAADPGTYAGVLSAKGNDGTVVRTAVSVLADKENYPVTIDATDRDGGKPGDFVAYMARLDQPEEQIEFRVENGVFTGHAPPGKYTLAMLSWTNINTSGMTMTIMSQQVTVGRGPVALTADARQGKPVKANVDSPTATSTVAHATLQERLPDGSDFSVGSLVRGEGNLFAVPTKKPVTSHPYAFVHMTSMAEPLDTPGTRRLYNLLLRKDNEIPADPTFTVRDSDLAKVRARFHGSSDAVTGYRNNLAYLAGSDIGMGGVQDVTVPGEAIEYFSPGPDVEWVNRRTRTPDLFTTAAPKTYKARQTYTEDWFEAPFGPVAGGARCGAALRAVPSPLSPSGRGQTGSIGEYTSGRLALLRDGKELATTDDLSQGLLADDLPAESAEYTLRMSMSQSLPSLPLATNAKAEWTFRSARPEGPEDCARAPEVSLLALKTEGDFPLDNRAPKDRSFPLTVTGETGSTGKATALTDLTMKASFDDGRTWTTVPVTRAGQGAFRAVVPAPSGKGRTGYVSLRAAAHDSAGNGVTQEVIRAYGLKP